MRRLENKWGIFSLARGEMVDHVGNEKSVKYGTANRHYDISADYFHHSFSESLIELPINSVSF